MCGTRLALDELCPRCLLGNVISGLGNRAAPESADEAPRRIGEYELIEQIGHGGMGVVWKAQQRRLKRIVALKLVRGGCLPGEAAARRFRREAEAAAQLKHPNIVVIHEVGEYEEQLYLSMDLAEGGSLADWLKRVAFSSREAAALVAKIARGVHHAHEHQILHRDLKPANILLDSQGEPRVCDFGLARFGNEDLTLSGELLGTPAYLSPEQAAGNMRDLTPASDTYSIGAILYELLCGQPPFSAENLPALLRKVAEDDPMRPISHYSGGRIPFDLSTICLKCLEKEPSARYSSALALAEDLERWLRGEPILARPVARAERVWKWVRRKPVLAALWAAITLLMVVVAIVASVMNVRLDRERAQVEELAIGSRHQVARQLSESAQRYMVDGDYLRALPALAEAIAVGTGDTRRDELNRVRFGVLRRLSPKLAQAWVSGEMVTRAEANHDGTRLFLTTENTAEVWDTVHGARIGERISFDQTISNAQFDSENGQWALIELSGKIHHWDVGSGQLRKLAEGSIHSPQDWYLQRTPYFIAYREKFAEVRRLDSGERVGAPLPHEATVEWAVLLPGLDRAFVCDAKGTLYLWDIQKSALIAPPIVLKSGGRSVYFGAFDPSTVTAAVHREKSAWVVDCRTGALASEHLKLEDTPQTFACDASGTWQFLARNNDGVTLRQLKSDTIRWPWPHRGLGFRGSFAMVTGLAATQSWNGSARVWRLSNGRPETPYLWQTATPGNCLLDPKGKWLLTRGDEPAARLWSLRPGEDVLQTPEFTFLEKPIALWASPLQPEIFVADQSGVVQGWSTDRPRRKLGEARHAEGQIRIANGSGDGKRFLTVGTLIAQVWQVATWLPTGEPYRADGEILDAKLDEAGDQMVVASADGVVQVRPVKPGGVEATLKAVAREVSFSRDGRQVLVVGRKGAQVWHVASGKVIMPPPLEEVSEVRALFSPDGKWVAEWNARGVAGQNRARVWSAATGEVRSQLAPHWVKLTDLAWSPDGERIATGGDDQTILICDVASGSPLVHPIKLTQKVADVGFSPDGALLWARAEKEITIWDPGTGEPVTPSIRQIRLPLQIVPCGRGRMLAVSGDRSLPWLLDFEPEARTPDELKLMAMALSGHALAPGTSALRPLEKAELRVAWEKARLLLGAW
jgi:eukaryotic-like serine/threonine-protein kinase